MLVSAITVLPEQDAQRDRHVPANENGSQSPGSSECIICRGPETDVRRTTRTVCCTSIANRLYRSTRKMLIALVAFGFAASQCDELSR